MGQAEAAIPPPHGNGKPWPTQAPQPAGRACLMRRASQVAVALLELIERVAAERFSEAERPSGSSKTLRPPRSRPRSRSRSRSRPSSRRPSSRAQSDDMRPESVAYHSAPEFLGMQTSPEHLPPHLHAIPSLQPPRPASLSIMVQSRPRQSPAPRLSVSSRNTDFADEVEQSLRPGLHDMAVILFADIVGFTALAFKTDPTILVH